MHTEFSCVPEEIHGIIAAYGLCNKSLRKSKIAVVMYFKNWNFDIEKNLSTYVRHILSIQHEYTFFTLSPSKIGFKTKMNTRRTQAVSTQ